MPSPYFLIAPQLILVFLLHQPILIVPFSISESETVSSISTPDMLADQKMNRALTIKMRFNAESVL